MSFTNLIEDGGISIIQGVGGIRLYEEEWMKSGILKKEDSNYNISPCINYRNILDVRFNINFPKEGG